ncbi:MAG: DUF480 domain-containing protein [Proteobacteria bacterium]|nr:DUF480 domain-containing protein [Pseudomonadota bacterium]
MLNPIEARIIGCLMEKSVVTPDQYPLTLNALLNACNQKSARDPVLSLDPGVVQHAARDLATRHLVRIEENPRNGVEKYIQRFCNTTYSDFKFEPDQYAIMCLALLRGAQTPGEFRAHSGRLHTFSDNNEVSRTLDTLMERDNGALLVKLPRAPGRKDAQYMHLLSGPIDPAVYAEAADSARGSTTSSTERINVASLAERISALEADMAEVKALLEMRRKD